MPANPDRCDLARIPDPGFAPAKVNLFLHVTGRRPDGYHLLDSLVVFAGIGDHVTVKPGEGLTLELSGEQSELVPPGAGNLVLTAAERLRQLLGKAGLGARLGLHKILPVAAGIGGGSADAAAALRVLAKLWRADLRAAPLYALAAGLGADVPVCLGRRPTWMRGIGEILAPAPGLPSAWLVLVNPRVPVATGRVFARLNRHGGEPPKRPQSFTDIKEFARFLAECGNDLQPPAIEEAPVITDVLRALASDRNCLLARMSGSGATCFGLFASARDADDDAAMLRRRAPSWWVESSAMLGAETEASVPLPTT